MYSDSFLRRSLIFLTLVFALFACGGGGGGNSGSNSGTVSVTIDGVTYTYSTSSQSTIGNYASAYYSDSIGIWTNIKFASQSYSDNLYIPLAQRPSVIDASSSAPAYVSVDATIFSDTPTAEITEATPTEASYQTTSLGNLEIWVTLENGESYKILKGTCGDSFKRLLYPCVAR